MAPASSNSRIIAAGAIGNVLEWYDFAVYGYFATAIGRAFFPSEDKVAQVLAAFGIFAVGFLMRPVGGALIGYIGDRLGRRAALTFSVAAMAIPTFLVGVLPGYQVLGVAAPILLTLLRMIQGLSVGGEYTTSIVFMVEQRQARPPRRDRRAWAAAAPSAASWRARRPARCWRRLMSAGGARALGLAHSVPAGPAGRPGRLLPAPRHPRGRRRPRKAARSPLARDAAATIGRCCCAWPALSVFNAVGFYLMFVYIVSWLQLADGVAPARALGINTISMALLLPLMIAMGWLSRPHRPPPGACWRPRPSPSSPPGRCSG